MRDIKWRIYPLPHTLAEYGMYAEREGRSAQFARSTVGNDLRLPQTTS